MKNKSQTAKAKSKGLSASIISLSCVLFIASAVLIFLSLFQGREPAVQQSVNSGVNTDDTVQITPQEDINSALNDALVSVVLDKYSVRSTDIFKSQTCIVNSVDSKTLLESYTEYLDSLAVEGIRYNLLYGDYDNDGATEYYLYVYFPVEATFSAINNSGAYTDYINNSGDKDCSHGVIIYADTHNGQTAFRSYYSGLDYHGEHSVSVSDGVMKVSHGTAVDEIYVVCTPYTVYESYAYQEDAFVSMCNSYAASLVSQGYSEVYYHCVDISDADGEETVFVYTDKLGKVNVRVVTFINGKIHYIYENSSELCATYLTEIDSVKYLIEYTQVLDTETDSYESSYFYKIYRFDGNYITVEHSRDDTVVKYGTVSSENEEFFERFNAYIANALVLSDPYEITGYGSLSHSTGMTTHGGADGNTDTDNQQAYLNISNCSTSKQGIVNVPETTHLNFRKGPAVSYPKILIDQTDDESFVRQLRGSSVTVIDTVNTGDEENPVWVKIQIKYNDLTLEGYSSQSWIDLPGIRHISVGSTFDIEADTNETSLLWSCNDTSVARVDSATGVVTAIKPGLVVITVKSESGLSDSCLIMVD